MKYQTIKLTKLTINGKTVTLSTESGLAIVRCHGMHMSYPVKGARVSEWCLREAVSKLGTPIFLNITRETGTIKQAGSIGVCMTKAGRHMAYMVDEEGNVCNTSVYENREDDMHRAMLLAFMYDTWGESEFRDSYKRA